MRIGERCKKGSKLALEFSELEIGDHCCTFMTDNSTFQATVRVISHSSSFELLVILMIFRSFEMSYNDCNDDYSNDNNCTQYRDKYNPPYLTF